MTDPQKIKRLTPDIIKRTLPTPESTALYIKEHAKPMTYGDLIDLKAKVDEITRIDESGLAAKLASQVLYWAKDRIKISPKTLYMIMSNFDKLAPYMPNEFWKGVAEIVDKVGEELLKWEKGSQTKN